jgi:hypothetical protein
MIQTGYHMSMTGNNWSGVVTIGQILALFSCPIFAVATREQ